MYITCQLKGGVGNQLFQIATAWAYSKEHDVDFCLAQDDPGFSATTGNRPSKYYETLYRRLPRRKLSGEMAVYEEPGFPYINLSPAVLHCKEHGRNLMLRGYFQSEKYFRKYREEIRKLFNPSPDGQSLKDYIRDNTDIFKRYPELYEGLPQACLIGVRRGDYASTEAMRKTHNPATVQYYKNAMNEMCAPIYYVISDDIPWCRENLPKSESELRFLEEPDDFITLLFSTLFKNYICANSTFHWWSSYLSVYGDDTKVITPKEHFGPTGPANFADYFREEMIQISNDPPVRPITPPPSPPRLTVLLPLQCPCRPETIKSLLSQTYQNWVCIIGLAEGVTAPTLPDSRFNAVVHSGDPLLYAETDWIAYMNNGDIWLPQKLQEQVSALMGPALGSALICTNTFNLQASPGTPAAVLEGPLSPAQLCHIIPGTTLVHRRAIGMLQDSSQGYMAYALRAKLVGTRC